jgi:hypothetical protein
VALAGGARRYTPSMSLAAAWLLALGAPRVDGASGQDWTPAQDSPRVEEFWKISRPRWETGQLVLQGFLGANLFQTMERSGGSTPDVDGSGETASQLPVIGGGGQWKLGGESVDFGVEAMFSFSGRADATAFAVGGGGATVAVKVDMVLFEIYGGPVANLFLNDTTRVYVSAGPLMEWADFTQKNDSANIHGNGTGFGTGLYARTGIEFATPNHTMIGLGIRWADSRVDLDNELGTLDLTGTQIVFTVTEGF